MVVILLSARALSLWARISQKINYFGSEMGAEMLKTNTNPPFWRCSGNIIAVATDLKQCRIWLGTFCCRQHFCVVHAPKSNHFVFKIMKISGTSLRISWEYLYCQEPEIQPRTIFICLLCEKQLILVIPINNKLLPASKRACPTF